MKKIDDITIDKIEYPNLGLVEAYPLGQKTKPLEVKNALPGQRVRCRLQGARKKRIKGTVLELLEASPLQVQAGCGLDGHCGGCLYQTLDFEAEASIKKQAIQDLFRGIYDQDIPYHPLENTYYRNKMEYSFGDAVKGGPLVLGLHCRGRFYEITETDTCNIAPRDFQTIRRAVQAYFRDLGLPFYHTMRREGILRHLVLKKSFARNEIMVNLVTCSYDLEARAFVDRLLALDLEGEIVSIYHTINDQASDAVICDQLHHLYGTEYLTESLLGLDFQLGPFSFFQPNPQGADRMFQRAKEILGRKKVNRVLDLYSGTGTLGQIFASVGKEVIGIEIIEEAVAFAKDNARKNGISNARFLAGDVLEELEKIPEADLILIDPPRPGIHPKAIDQIIAYQAPEILYISCNPRSQKRDLEIFIDQGYEIKTLEVFDQFARTPHVESLALLTRS